MNFEPIMTSLEVFICRVPEKNKITMIIKISLIGVEQPKFLKQYLSHQRDSTVPLLSKNTITFKRDAFYPPRHATLH